MAPGAWDWPREGVFVVLEVLGAVFWTIADVEAIEAVFWVGEAVEALEVVVVAGVVVEEMTSPAALVTIVVTAPSGAVVVVVVSPEEPEEGDAAAGVAVPEGGSEARALETLVMELMLICSFPVTV
jgi:hypothetical protein